MKVLWLSHLVPYPPKGGVLQRSYNLIREVSKYHDIYLLAFIQRDLIESHFDSYAEGLKEASDKLSEFCSKVKFVPISCDRNKYGKHYLAVKSLFTKYPYNINWLYSEEYTKTLKEWKSDIKFDLVHYDTISLAPYISELNGIVSVLDHHNVESHMMLRRSSKENNIIKKIYFYQEGVRLRTYEKKICPAFKINITCSSLDSELLSQVTGNINIRVIPNGVDLNYFDPATNGDGMKRLVFVGMLNWYPNEQAVKFIAHELWPLIKQEIPDLSIDIIGPCPPTSITEVAKEDDGFNVYGYIDDVRPYIERAAIYICPIKDGGGTKLKILDALAMKKAIIADPIACEGIEVTNNVNVLFASTPKEYMAKIKKVISNEEMRITLGVNGRILAKEKYSFESIGKLLAGVYDECIR